MSKYDYEYPYSDDDEKFDRQFNKFAGVVVGIWIFFAFIRPLMIYFNLI